MKNIVIKSSPELSYILSNFIVGDGGCYGIKRGNRVNGVLRLTAVDKEFVEEFGRNVLKVFHNYRELYIGRTKPRRKCEQWLYKFEIKNTPFYNWFKSQTEERLMYLCEKYPKHFLQSWFDSDGYCGIYRGVNNKGHKFIILKLRLQSTHKKWLEFAQRLLLQYFEIDSSLSFRNTLKSGKEMWVLRLDKKDSIEKYYNNIGFVIKRKQRKLVECVEYINSRK
nr:MAG: homing endonuclease [Lokiarchaeota virus Ratatoskr Meg22_1012]